MTVRTVTTAYGAAALATLSEVVAEAKAADPMAAVTLLVPNNLSGIQARRHLARQPAPRGSQGVAGVFVATAIRLAEQLAAPILASRRPATTPVVAAAWRAALDHAPGVFETVKDHPATIRALVSAHRELRDLTEPALTAVANASALAADLVRLHRDVTTALRPGWYDQRDIADAATQRLSGPTDVTAELGTVVLYLPQELLLAEARFVAALGERAPVTVVVAMTDVARADRTTRRSLERVGVGDDLPRGRPRVASEVFHASDSDDEIRCVVRDLVRTLRSTPAERVAVLYGAAQPYARLLHEHLGVAGVQVNGAGTRPILERAVGRAFLDVLSLAAVDVPRADLFRAVSEAPTLAFDGSRVPASRWERLSRSAAVVGGDDWERRLTAYAEGVAADLAAEEARDDPYPARIDGYRRDIDAVGALQSFATTLRTRLRTGLALTTWPALGSWALELFAALYGDTAVLARMPPEEQAAAVAVQSVLGGLAELDAFESSADLQGLIDVLTLELESALPRVGRFGEGVLVAPLSAAVGLDVDVLYVVGLAEDSYPGRLVEDALLLEQVRVASQGELPSYRDRLDARHRHLLAAFDAAPRVVASFPRGDLRRSTGRLPTRFLLPTLRELSGNKALAATEWESAVSDRISGSPSYALSLTNVPLPASEQEWRVRATAAGLTLDDPLVDAGRALARGRASAEFTRFDGNLAGVEGLPDYADGRRLVSPTALEAFASCPHAYFVERLLRVAPVEQPEEIITISPIDIGNLVHETMDDFVTETGDALPGFGEPWTAAQRGRLREIAVAKAAEFERRGVTGHQRLWQAERDKVLADLDAMLDSDDERRRGRDARVLRSELTFGRDGAEPVVIPVADGRVAMRGSADLVEQARDGTLLVIDIKTGGTSRFSKMKQDPIVGGTKLQLPVYAEAARQLLGGERAEAAYWFVRQGKRDWIDLELTPDLSERYAQAVGTLVAAIADGQFPAMAPEVPDFAWVQCPYCNHDGLGHGEVRTRWERKRVDPVLRDLVGLIDPAAVLAAAGAEGPESGATS